MLLSIVVGTLGRNEPALLKIMGCVKKIIRLGHDKGLFSRHQFTQWENLHKKVPLKLGSNMILLRSICKPLWMGKGLSRNARVSFV